MRIVKSILIAFVVIFVAFVVISIFDVVLSVLHRRFYSNAAFIVIFGVGGVFAAFYAYTLARDFAGDKSNVTRWSIIIAMILAGLSYFFIFSELEGGEYEAAFKSFGVTLALTSLLIAKLKDP